MVSSVQVAVLEKEDNISDRNPFPIIFILGPVVLSAGAFLGYVIFKNKHKWMPREDTATNVCRSDENLLSDSGNFGSNGTGTDFGSTPQTNNENNKSLLIKKCCAIV
jgi:hypothetical protein